MSYNFKKIGDLELLNVKPDGASVVIEAEGAVKRLQADKVGVTSWNGLEDKPFGEEIKVVNEPLNITWDGNTEGLVSSSDGWLWKISDAVLTNEQIKSATITAGSESVSLSNVWEQLIVGEDVVCAEGFAFCRKSGASDGYSTYPEAGIYSISKDGAFVSSITTTEPVEQTKTVVKPIDEKYLPDSVKGGGTASAIPDDEMLEFLMDMDIVQPLSNTNNAVYTDGNNKLYVL